jgi:hypothetical protein
MIVFCKDAGIYNDQHHDMIAYRPDQLLINKIPSSLVVGRLKETQMGV